MSIQTSTDNQAKEKAVSRLYELLALQKKVECFCILKNG